MAILTMFLELAGGLALFMYGMERTSDGIQRAAGERLQKTLNFMTRNSVMAVLTGTVVTVAVQSSSATTVMLITFVNAGLLSLTQGIGVIMGANIGTTLTGWIIAGIGVAKFSIAALAVPIFGLGFFMSITKRRSDAFKSYGNALMGLALIFLGLGFIGEAIPQPSEEILLFLSNFQNMGFVAVILAVLAGTVFTILINASSATLAIVIAMASQGIINFEIAAALTLGANIGTTFDAFLASIAKGASANAKRAAWAHILFNVLGTVWVVILFKPFIALVGWAVPGELGPQNVGAHIAMLHTLFNTANTLVLLPFVNKYAALLERLVPEKPGEAELRAIYLPRTVMATPELSLVQARKEIGDMAAIAKAMFARVRADFAAEPEDFEEEIAWFTAKENYVDGMHEELTRFLIAITTGDLTERTRAPHRHEAAYHLRAGRHERRVPQHRLPAAKKAEQGARAGARIAGGPPALRRPGRRSPDFRGGTPGDRPDRDRAGPGDRDGRQDRRVQAAPEEGGAQAAEPGREREVGTALHRPGAAR